jgi:hypothetical protein
MILVDLNQVMISNLMIQVGGNKDVDLDENLFRHMILNSLRSNRTKFNEKFGELVICCDDKNFWRKEIFPYYKANRKKNRDQSGIDWSTVFNTLNKVRDEIETFFPYKVIRVETAEADDVIGTLVKHNHDEPLLILSGDKDFIQLHKYPKVKQYDPVHKRWLGDKNPKRYLIEHIAKGDRGDGIPNFISPDTCFVNGIRQKPLRAKYLDNLKGDNIDNVQQAFEDEELKRGWIRNRLIIDLDHIPEGIEEQILSKFNTPQKGRDKMFNYFITHKLKHLMEDISEF